MLSDERLKQLVSMGPEYIGTHDEWKAVGSELLAIRGRLNVLYSEVEIRKAVRNRTGGETWVLEELREMRATKAASLPDECCACHDRCSDCPIDKEAHRKLMTGPGAPAPKPEDTSLGVEDSETPRWTCAIDSCPSEWYGFAKGCSEHPSVAWLPLNPSAAWAWVKSTNPRAYAMLRDAREAPKPAPGVDPEEHRRLGERLAEKGLIPRPARLYSEEEVEKVLRSTLMLPEEAESVLRRLRGEGGARPSREELLQGLGFGAPKRDCDLHDLGQPGFCTCRGVPL